MRTHYPYLIEQVCSGTIPISTPGRKYALLIRSGKPSSGQWDLSRTIMNLVNHHDYHNIEIIEPYGSPGFPGSAFTDRNVYLPRLCDRLRNLGKDLGEDMHIQISYFGPLVHNGSDFVIPSSDGDLSGKEVLSALTSVPLVSCIHYVGFSSNYSGDFARCIAGVQHADLGARHIAVSPKSPSFIEEAKEDDGRYNRGTFEERFFGKSRHRSLDTRFRASARTQAERAGLIEQVPHAYLGYAHISPTHVSL